MLLLVAHGPSGFRCAGRPSVRSILSGSAERLPGGCAACCAWLCCSPHFPGTAHLMHVRKRCVFLAKRLCPGHHIHHSPHAPPTAVLNGTVKMSVCQGKRGVKGQTPPAVCDLTWPPSPTSLRWNPIHANGLQETTFPSCQCSAGLRGPAIARQVEVVVANGVPLAQAGEVARSGVPSLFEPREPSAQLPLAG